MKIEMELPDWSADKITTAVVQNLEKQIINDSNKYYGDIPEEGCYTEYDKFKNQVANLVANKLTEKIIASDTVQNRIAIILDRVEESIKNRAHKNLSLPKPKKGKNRQ